MVQPQRLRAAIHEIREVEAFYHRVIKVLVRAGGMINHERVWRIMRQANLLCRRKRGMVHTTDAKRLHSSLGYVPAF